MNRQPLARSLLIAVALVPAGRAVAQSITTAHVVHVDGTPVSITAPPADDRLFIVELEGRIRIVDGGAVLATPFLDVTALVAGGPFTGLRSLAFPPDYSLSGAFYVAYDGPSAAGRELVIARYTVAAGSPNLADPASRVEVLRIADEDGNPGGDLHFGPDGMLYTITGDGHGNGGDPGCNAQDLGLLWGKMLRIDVRAGAPYSIPPDNPFVGDPTARDEIWHAGFRHPWRWSFDRETGDVYVGDVGEIGREEVSFQPAGVGGLNFGWKVMEGTGCHSSAGCPAAVPGCGAAELAPPIHEYVHGGAVCYAVIGGFVYRGAAIPSLRGAYLFADYCLGRISSLRFDGSVVTEVVDRTSEMGGPFPQLTAFGEDAAGELYFTLEGGEVRRIVADCTTERYCTTSPNSAGPGAEIDSSGSASLALNRFTLHVTGAPPVQPGLFYYGPRRAALPFGDGVRCVDGFTSRLSPPLTTAADGSGARPLDFTAYPANGGAGEITAGSTWNFQFWYRDPGGPGGSGFNLSGALAALFCP